MLPAGPSAGTATASAPGTSPALAPTTTTSVQYVCADIQINAVIEKSPS